MNSFEEEIIYRLYKKGIDNFTKFDRLLMESNPIIKDEVNKLLEVNNESYEAVVKKSAVKYNEKKKTVQKNRRIYFYISVPAAACFIILFTMFYFYFNRRDSLGGSVILFVSSVSDPDVFYTKKDVFTGGEEISLAFQPGVDLKEEIRQGTVFSIDSSFNSRVYYRYNESMGVLSQNSSTKIEQNIILDKSIDYIYFFIILSGEDYDENEQINNIKQIIKIRHKKLDKYLINELKDKAFNYIYLWRES